MFRRKKDGEAHHETEADSGGGSTPSSHHVADGETGPDDLPPLEAVTEARAESGAAAPPEATPASEGPEVPQSDDSTPAGDAAREAPETTPTQPREQAESQPQGEGRRSGAASRPSGSSRGDNPAKKTPEIPANAPRRAAAPGRRGDRQRGGSGGEGRGEQESEGKRLVVGQEISLNGEITACDVLEVEGSMDAQVADARLLDLRGTGSFHGSAEVQDAEVDGTFNGTLYVRGQLTIKANGRVSGTVRYNSLVVENGGIITGDLGVLDESGRPEET